MSQTISDTMVSSVRIDLAEMIKNKIWDSTQTGMDERVAVRSIAKALEKSQEYVLHQLSIAELPLAIVGLLKKNPIAAHVALSIWKRANEDTVQAVQLLTRAIETANAVGAVKVMLKHAA